MYKCIHACVQCQAIHAAYRSLPTGTRSSIPQVNYSNSNKRRITSTTINITYMYVVYFLLCIYVLVYDNGSYLSHTTQERSFTMNYVLGQVQVQVLPCCHCIPSILHVNIPDIQKSSGYLQLRYITCVSITLSCT